MSLVLILSLVSAPATAARTSVLRACVEALTGARAYRPLDVRSWKGLDEPSPYAGLITPQWGEWDEVLTVEGEKPKDLKDAYLRMGPVGFDSLAGERKRSMIDSAGGLLRYYDLGQDRPTVRVRRVNTPAFRAEFEAGRFLYPSISTLVPGRPNGAGRMQNQASVAVYPRAGNFIVTDEMQRPVEMRADDLATLGEVTLDPEAPNAKYLAHAKRDPRNGNWCFVEFSIGQNMVGRVICLDPKGAVKWRSGPFTLPSLGGRGKAPYIHDWGLTDDHVVLYLQSYLFSLPGLAKTFLGIAPMMDALYTEPKLNSKIAVIGREDGVLEAFVDTGESAMTWHFVNVFEENGEVIMDTTSTIIDRKDSGLGGSMVYPILGKALPEQADGCFLKRLRVRIADQTLLENTILLRDANYEFPSIAPHLSGRPHRFAYLGRCHGARPWFTGVAKYDYLTHAVERFEFEPHEFAGEPMFAPRDGGRDEDDGYVLIEVYDGIKKKTALVVFDAHHVSGGPVARLWLSRHLPFGFHGLLFQSSRGEGARRTE